MYVQGEKEFGWMNNKFPYIEVRFNFSILLRSSTNTVRILPNILNKCDVNKKILSLRSSFKVKNA